MEYCSPVWNPQYVGNVKKIEAVQRSFTKRLKGLSNLTYSKRLFVLQAESLELRRLKSDLVLLFNIITGRSAIGNNLLSLDANIYCTRGHNFKLAKTHCSINCRLHSFAVRCMNIRNSLPARIVNSCSLSVFKRQLQMYDLNKFCVVLE